MSHKKILKDRNFSQHFLRNNPTWKLPSRIKSLMTRENCKSDGRMVIYPYFPYLTYEKNVPVQPAGVVTVGKLVQPQAIYRQSHWFPGKKLVGMLSIWPGVIFMIRVSTRTTISGHTPKVWLKKFELFSLFIISKSTISHISPNQFRKKDSSRGRIPIFYTILLSQTKTLFPSMHNERVYGTPKKK